MLDILGSKNPFDRGIDRRTVMSIGGLGAVSLSLPDVLRQESMAADDRPVGSTFGRAKRVLLIYLQGAASQFETWDPKPDAPKGVR